MDNINILEIIQCPYCAFSVMITKNQERAVCEHCRQIIDIATWKHLYELFNKKNS